MTCSLQSHPGNLFTSQGINLWSPLGAHSKGKICSPLCSSQGRWEFPFWEFPFWEWLAPNHKLLKTFHWEPEVERIPLESTEGSAEGTLHSRGKRENAESALSFLQKQGNPGVAFAAAKGIYPLAILAFPELGQAATQLHLHEIWEKRKSSTSHVFYRRRLMK